MRMNFSMQHAKFNINIHIADDVQYNHNLMKKTLQEEFKSFNMWKDTTDIQGYKLGHSANFMYMEWYLKTPISRILISNRV